MTRGHFRAFLSLACGILQVENGFEIYPLSNTFFCIFAFSFASGEGKKEGANACSLLLPFSSFHSCRSHQFTRSFCFQPRPQSVCRAKTHVNVCKKAAQRKMILRNSGNCLRACFLRT